MSRLVALLLACALVVSCTGNTSSPTAPVSVPVFNQSTAASPSASGGHHGTPLSADEEVMPAGVVNTSRARGSAIFQINEAQTAITYQLIVANIENVFQAHIHRAAAGANGGIVVWLYPSTAPVAGPTGGGRIDGVIATGTITAANLVGSLAGQPLSALLAELSNGNAYVNVHTNDGVAPTNTGPGDYPGGEIRGQIEKRGQ